MEVFEHENQRPSQTAPDTELPESFEGFAFDRLRVRQSRRLASVLELQQMQKDGRILVRVHPDFAEPRTHLFDDDVGGVSLANPAIAAQQIEGEQVWDPGTIG